MTRKSFIVLSTLAIIGLLVAGGLYAGTKVDDAIKMENSAYDKHTRPIVTFSHKKHIEDYKIACGDCHHDAEAKPLTDLKMGDSVQKCIECHKTAGYVTGKAAQGLSDAQKREYHANAMHDNCISCHRDFNKEKGFGTRDPGAAPVLCATCHVQ